MRSGSSIAPTQATGGSEKARDRLDAPRLPEYATVPLRPAEQAPRIQATSIPAMSLMAFKEYVEAWADNSFQPIALDARIWVDRATLGTVDDYTMKLLREGFLRYEYNPEGRCVGIMPSKEGIGFLWRSLSMVASLSGNAAIIQPTTSLDSLHTNARFDLLATVNCLVPYGDVTYAVLERSLPWPSPSLTNWIRKLISQDLVMLNARQTGLVLTPNGVETLMGLQSPKSKPREINERIHLPSAERVKATVPEAVWHLSRLTGFSKGFSAREIGTVLGLSPQIFRRIDWLTPLVNEGILIRERGQQELGDPELGRLTTSTWLYRLAKPLEVSGPPSEAFAAVAQRLLEGRSRRLGVAGCGEVS